MTSRERIRRIIAGEPADRCGFWLGNPHEQTLPVYHKYFGTSTLEELQRKIGDDFRWITPLYIRSTYRHPEGKGLFDLWKYKGSLGEAGPLAACESIGQVSSYDWPSLEYLDLTECVEMLRGAGDYYQFYYDANEQLYEEAGDLIDAFFGNDFGTQRDLILAPDLFHEFVYPWFCKFTEQAHRHGYQVILHSCGSIYRVIDRLIDAGVECLHPIQAKAYKMDAETLARDFKGRIAFLGGIDTQDLLVNGGPEEVKAEVRRVKRLLGPRLIVSPSHESLLPNVSPANVVAMAEAALE